VMEGRIQQVFELIREEALERLTKRADYPGKLCEVSLEVSQLVMYEMGEYREAERHKVMSSTDTLGGEK